MPEDWLDIKLQIDFFLSWGCQHTIDALREDDCCTLLPLVKVQSSVSVVSLDKLSLLHHLKYNQNTLPQQTGFTLWAGVSAPGETQAWSWMKAIWDSKINSCSPCFDKPWKERNGETKTIGFLLLGLQYCYTENSHVKMKYDVTKPEEMRQHSCSSKDLKTSPHCSLQAPPKAHIGGGVGIETLKKIYR